MLRRQIQSAINEGRLVIPNMQVDQNHFPVHMSELNNPKVLVRPSQTESTKGKNKTGKTLGGQNKKKKADNKSTGLTSHSGGLTGSTGLTGHGTGLTG